MGAIKSFNLMWTDGQLGAFLIRQLIRLCQTAGSTIISRPPRLDEVATALSIGDIKRYRGESINNNLH
jgi:hypothetical protein